MHEGFAPAFRVGDDATPGDYPLNSDARSSHAPPFHTRSGVPLVRACLAQFRASARYPWRSAGRIPPPATPAGGPFRSNLSNVRPHHGLASASRVSDTATPGNYPLQAVARSSHTLPYVLPRLRLFCVRACSHESRATLDTPGLAVGLTAPTRRFQLGPSQVALLCQPTYVCGMTVYQSFPLSPPFELPTTNPASQVAPLTSRPLRACHCTTAFLACLILPCRHDHLCI